MLGDVKTGRARENAKKRTYDFGAWVQNHKDWDFVFCSLGAAEVGETDFCTVLGILETVGRALVVEGDSCVWK